MAINIAAWVLVIAFLYALEMGLLVAIIICYITLRVSFVALKVAFQFLKGRYKSWRTHTLQK